MQQWNQFSFQDAYSPVMEEFIYFHDFVMVILVFIMSVVGVMMFGLYSTPWVFKGLVEGQLLEWVWTVAPALILIILAVPSLGILYAMDETSDSAVTFKVVGHQWYWSYEFSEFWGNSSVVSFDSYMVPPLGQEEMGFRLLDTDSRLALPFKVPIRALVTSSDVLHSWAVPSLGVKMDATPGRLNQIKFSSDRPGLMFGQCSEICGANHSFMPIAVEFLSPSDFMYWITSSA